MSCKLLRQLQLLETGDLANVGLVTQPPAQTSATPGTDHTLHSVVAAGKHHFWWVLSSIHSICIPYYVLCMSTESTLNA